MKKRGLKNRILPYLMVSPYLIHLTLFILFPVVFSLILTFHKWNIISSPEFVGFDNFLRLFQDRLFWKAIINTIVFLLVHIPLQIIVALTLAYLPLLWHICLIKKYLCGDFSEQLFFCL